jgi:hypothetical protein
MNEVYETRAVCSTIVDDLLEAQLEAETSAPIEIAPGHVCSTVVDDLLEAQLRQG